MVNICVSDTMGDNFKSFFCRGRGFTGIFAGNMLDGLPPAFIVANERGQDLNDERYFARK